MRQILKYTGYILVLLIVGFLLYKFYYIIGWLLIAAVISFIGEPLVKFFDKAHIKKIYLPHWLSTIMALFIILLFFLGLLSIFVPLIISQADAISKIDLNQVSEELHGPIEWLDAKLRASGTIQENQTFNDYITERIGSIINIDNIGAFLGGFVSAAGNIFVGLFAILFISFFFLKDETMFEQGVLLLVPEKHDEKTRKVIQDSKVLLKRYFIGILLELLSVISLMSLGLWILGVKNALLIGFFAGLMNIIPYLGPVLGAAIGLSLGITGALSGGGVSELLPVIIKLLSVIIVVQFVDNNILVPTIYSKSVKSHPLEIFLVIIMGGGLAGFPGMLLAVPAYTVLRVIAREFFQEFRVVQKITETMEKE
ncbi:MAG TPA: AI-2E family transporter [Bacteroidales bacterium]|nr:AI-2E family transporter [Bacteroidales bacterium]